jgi:hypothetical protein
MAALESSDHNRITGTTVPPEAVLDLTGAEAVIDLTGAPSARANPATVPAGVGGFDGFEHRDATQQARYIAVLVIAVLNVFDIITTYVAISLGAHEGNPLIAWVISTPFVAVAKILVCSTLIAGAVLAKHWRRRVSLPALCMAWAVVGVYSVVVLVNVLNVLSRR